MKKFELISIAALVFMSFVIAAPVHGVEENYYLGSGDRVRVTVFGHEDLR